MAEIIDVPNKQNSILDAEAVVIEPIYAQREAIARLFGISASTVSRYLKMAEDARVEEITIKVSYNLTLIHIKNFENYLKKFHKLYL